MSEIKIINGQSLPNIPWQERPADLEEGAVLWRYTENPVMGRNPTPKIGRIFNSAVVPWQDGYIAVLRGEQVNGVPHVYLGRSKDGIRWNVDRERVQFVDENGEPWMPNYAYDPRLVKVEDTYYIIWCTDFHGAAIGMAKTKDFKNTPYNCAQTIHVIPADQNFEKKRSSSALFAHEINLVTQPSFDCEQGINSQVQTACSNADAIFPVLGIVSCRNERFSLSRKTHVPLWNEPRISHVRLL